MILCAARVAESFVQLFDVEWVLSWRSSGDVEQCDKCRLPSSSVCFCLAFAFCRLLIDQRLDRNHAMCFYYL